MSYLKKNESDNNLRLLIISLTQKNAIRFIDIHLCATIFKGNCQKNRIFFILNFLIKYSQFYN